MSNSISIFFEGGVEEAALLGGLALSRINVLAITFATKMH